MPFNEVDDDLVLRLGTDTQCCGCHQGKVKLLRKASNCYD